MKPFLVSLFLLLLSLIGVDILVGAAMYLRLAFILPAMLEHLKLCSLRSEQVLDVEVGQSMLSPGPDPTVLTSIITLITREES